MNLHGNNGDERNDWVWPYRTATSNEPINLARINAAQDSRRVHSYLSVIVEDVSGNVPSGRAFIAVVTELEASMHVWIKGAALMLYTRSWGKDCCLIYKATWAVLLEDHLNRRNSWVLFPLIFRFLNSYTLFCNLPHFTLSRIFFLSFAGFLHLNRRNWVKKHD
jgi:hypothetical protein